LNKHIFYETPHDSSLRRVAEELQLLVIGRRRVTTAKAKRVSELNKCIGIIRITGIILFFLAYQMLLMVVFWVFLICNE
jgi:hypothetical protein